MRKRIIIMISSIFLILQYGFSQVRENAENAILFHGLVMDATTFSPISNSQIMINRSFSSITGSDGSFSFYVNRNDTVLFKSLGYKSAVLHVSDTLIGGEFITGIYMNSDTLSIGEVIIVPRLSNLKSEIMNPKPRTDVNMENARYNVAVSAYQGRNSQNILGNPADNYAFLIQKQKVAAFEKGGIPSDQIAGISPLLLIPAAYLLIHGLPENPVPLQQHISDQEVDQINRMYLEKIKQKK